MKYENTELYFLEKDLLRNFGEELGKRIFQGASKLYTELAVTTDYKNSPTYERQLRRLVYPVIAYYKTLLVFGYRAPAALGLVRNETQKAAAETGRVLASQMRPVFPFRAFRGNIKNFIEYKFPSCGWKTKNLRVKGNNIDFDVQECLYDIITAKFGCPELCTVFCDYEAKAWEGLLPQVVAERGGTIATGHEVCDFHFRKGSRRAKKE